MRHFFSWFNALVFKRRIVANLPIGDDAEILNEQVPSWMLLKERQIARAAANQASKIQLLKPEVDLSRWPGHGAPFLKKDRQP